MQLSESKLSAAEFIQEIYYRGEIHFLELLQTFAVGFMKVLICKRLT